MRLVRLFPVFSLALLLGAPALAQPTPEGLDAPQVEEVAPAPLLMRVVNPAFPPPLAEPRQEAPAPVLSREGLAPYFAAGALADAKVAFDAGRYAQARASLDGATPTPPVRFLRALSALRGRDAAAAAAEFEALAADYGPLRDRCFVHAGQAFEALKDWSAAERVYGQVPETSRLVVDAQLGRARALLRLKRLKDAHQVVGPLAARPTPAWGRDVGAEALLLQADLFNAGGDAKHEREALRALWARHPLARPEASRAEARLGNVTELEPELLVARGEALIEAHRNAQGVALIEPLLPKLELPAVTACRARFAVGKGYRKLRKHALAIQALGPVVQRCQDRELRAKALYTLGFSQSISAPSLAAGTYATLASAIADHPLADDALFLAADLQLRRGEVAPAVEKLVDVVDRYGDGDFAAEALFKLFWVRWTESRLDDALVLLEELEGRAGAAGDAYEVERARYWRGRVLENLGRREDAVAVLSSNAAAHPTSYYGLISRERVEALAPERGAALIAAAKAAVSAADPFPLRLGPLATDERFLAAVELLRLGLRELVPGEVLAIDRAGLPKEALRALVLLLSQAGMERQAHGFARLWLKADLSGPITAQGRALWEIAYPRAYRDLVVTHTAAADGLDPDLLQALMREESALDPKALSWAGALGLCQLMPTTAAEVASQLKVARPSTAQLLEPELNVRLGARYLANLLLRARGVKQFALAGYNAGEGSVSRWRRENGDEDLAAWVEQIPIQETRGYVKRVLRTYNTYKLLYAPADVARTVAPFERPARAITKG